MNKITVSAPGKLMLLGEHAVVYNHPCIVTAVDQRMTLTAQLTDKPTFELNAPDVNIKNYKKNLPEIGKGEIPKASSFVESATANFAKKFKIKNGLKIATKLQFSSKFGFGSSSASTVCTIFALSKLFNIKLSQKQIFDLAYETVLGIQGKGSGFDVAAAIWGGTLYFKTAGKIIKPLKISAIPLIVGYTGTKVDTPTIVNLVAKFAQKHPKTVENIYKQIELLVNLSVKEIERARWHELGELMDINQGYLEALGVSSAKLSQMIYAARNSGAYGAKLSGAGIGDCMIALSKNPKVKSAIEKAGGQVINVKTNAPGVRIEK